ncbi:acetyl-CoA carboxylase carboxyltransferase subunit beta (plasmid) [Lactiplantibacillus plantarum]|uniref:acetyl-CoA carboxylase carboxyltransferase subunit beta n=1 Tax=Lactiplantibacillus plantarum TaxID=1590 RepID=UPI00338E84EB
MNKNLLNKKAHHSSCIAPNFDAKFADGSWVQCPYCKKSFSSHELGIYKECPNCSFGFRLSARERLKLITTNFKEINHDLQTEATECGFPNFGEKYLKAQQYTGLQEGVLTGIAKIEDFSVCLGIFDPNFIMGSMGTIVGEKLTKLFELALAEKLPVILFINSGGARMQEGINSLMQMAKISSAVKEHSNGGLLYTAVLCDPTMGGVSASFGFQADITIAEPHSRIGFAGPRVVVNATHEQLPDDFQRAESLYKHGFLDEIVPRSTVRKYLISILKLYSKRR